ncbi:MAG: hypothetical protein Q8M03_16535 [Legionella sp.]|nr:hypothetical protein [Legionella sp.]
MNTSLKESVLSLINNNNQNELLNQLKGTILYDLAIKESAVQGNTDLVNKLFNQLGMPLKPPYTTAELGRLNQAVGGYALGGYFNQVEFLVRQGANIYFAIRQLYLANQLDKQAISSLVDCALPNQQAQVLITISTLLGANPLPAEQFDLSGITNS